MIGSELMQRCQTHLGMRLSRRAWFAAWMLTASVSCRSDSFAMALGTPVQAATHPSQATTNGRKCASKKQRCRNALGQGRLCT